MLKKLTSILDKKNKDNFDYDVMLSYGDCGGVYDNKNAFGDKDD